MSAPTQESSACVRAWQALRAAQERVSRCLGAALAAECGLTIHECDVLVHLRAYPPLGMRIGALLEAVPLSQPALSRLVSRLEARGLLARGGAAGDGRATVVRLTDAGSALAERATAVHARAVHDALIGEFTEDEQAALVRILSRVGR